MLKLLSPSFGERGANEAVEQVEGENCSGGVPAGLFVEEQDDHKSAKQDAPERASCAEVDFLKARVADVADHQA